MSSGRLLDNFHEIDRFAPEFEKKVGQIKPEQNQIIKSRGS